MSTMPQLKDFRDFSQFSAAHRAWAESPDGIAEMEAVNRRSEEAKKAKRERFLAELGPAQVSYVNGLGIPARALAAARGTMEKTAALNASTGSTDFLVLSGGPGAGKTVAAAVWIMAYVCDAKYWGESRLVGSERPEFSGMAPVWVTAAKLARWDRYEEEQMAKLLRTPRLVIDDLGGEYLDKGGFYASLLDEIVNERQAESRPTIMTTNLDAEGFKSRYGERIVDRIREGGRFVGCGSHSLRGNGGV